MYKTSLQTDLKLIFIWTTPFELNILVYNKKKCSIVQELKISKKTNINSFHKYSESVEKVLFFNLYCNKTNFFVISS